MAFDSSWKDVARRVAVDILAKCRVLVCVGHGKSVTLNVSNDLLESEHAVFGSEYFRYDELEDNLSLLQQNLETVSRAISHRIPAGRIPAGRIDEAFELVLSGETGKVVITQEEHA